MKKGFTLIELLIVMIIVAVMVVIAVPQYRRSVERGRAMEGLTNTRAAADYAISYMLLHDGTLPVDGDNVLKFVDLIKSNHFEAPVLGSVAGEEDRLKVSVQRKAGSGWSYKFEEVFSTSTLDPLTLQCINIDTEDVCDQLGFEANTNLL